MKAASPLATACTTNAAPILLSASAKWIVIVLQLHCIISIVDVGDGDDGVCDDRVFEVIEFRIVCHL